MQSEMENLCHLNYHCAMKITIDGAGRIVVPKPLRDRFNLAAGTELEIEAIGGGLRLRKIDSEPALIQKHGVWVHHGGTRSDIDVSEFINNERHVRIGHFTDDAD